MFKRYIVCMKVHKVKVSTILYIFMLYFSLISDAEMQQKSFPKQIPQRNAIRYPSIPLFINESLP